MSRSFILPDLGEGIHEGEVVAVLVKVGDTVAEDQPILVVETDKAAVEIPSPFGGVVEQVKVRPGDLVRVGDEMILFSGDGAKAVPAEPGPAEAAAVSPSGAEAKAEGVAAPVRPTGPVPASPATRRLARELGVDLRSVAGSGPAGLVTAEDVRAFSAGVRPVPGPEAPEASVPIHLEPEAPAGARAPGSTVLRPSAVPVPPLPDLARWGPVERHPLRSVRRATAKHMAMAWSQIPHVNHQDWADVTELEALRRKHKEAVETQGGKLTLTVFVLKAVVAALKAFPQFNVSLDADAEEIVFKRYYHLGVATDTGRGLVVPVVRDVDRKSIVELAVELTELIERTRQGQVGLDELQGGTFTVTNIGALGGTGFAPIVNYPEAAILGLGKAQLQPVVRGTLDEYEIVARLKMPLVLAFDHRVLDGAEAARFVNLVIQMLEDPETLLLAV